MEDNVTMEELRMIDARPEQAMYGSGFNNMLTSPWLMLVLLIAIIILIIWIGIVTGAFTNAFNKLKKTTEAGGAVK